MTITPGLQDDELRRLRALYPRDPRETEADERTAGAPGHEAGGARAVLKRVAQRVIRRGIAWYVDATAEEAAVRAARATYRRLEAQLPDRGLGDEARITAINMELLKGEFRGLLRTIEDLGQAIAPAAGLAGAASRMAEIRERLNDLDRRTRATAAASSGAPLEPHAARAEAEPPAPASGTVFDYLGFERRFRGGSEQILASQRERYLEMLRGHAPVLDVGCGRGELVGALNEAGITASGVDLDLESVTEARARGRDVRQADALDALRAAEPGSLGAVVAFHVVEHMDFPRLLEMIEVAASRLRPGGLFIAETPNPAALFVLGNTYILDPTHVRPLHPSLFVFLCERAGFRDVELRFHEPALEHQLPLIEGDGIPDWAATINTAFERLNDVLFGPQEYAVIATARPN